METSVSLQASLKDCTRNNLHRVNNFLYSHSRLTLLSKGRMLSTVPISVLTDSYKAGYFMQYPEAKKMVAVRVSACNQSNSGSIESLASYRAHMQGIQWHMLFKK